MIGLSLSFCVSDIVRGEVPIERVEKIVAGTAAATPTQWEEVIEMYRKGCWAFNPNACEYVARMLLDQGKVEQPRLGDPPLCPDLTDGLHWVQVEADVILMPT